MNSFIVKNNIDKNYLNKYSLYPKKIHVGIFMLCVKGNAVVSINLRQHNVKENDFIVLLPDSITHVLSLSDDVLFYYVGVSKEHLTNLDFIKSTINIYPIMIDHPVLPMDAPIAQLYKEGYLLLSKASALSKNCISHNKELIVALLTIILQGTTELYAQHKEWVNCQHNRTYELSRKFIQLVIDNYKEQHKVSFYATQLNVSLPHFSTTVKKSVGMTPLEFISSVITMDAKARLKSTDMSVKEIAFALGFSNLSFFNKYFRQHTGMTPQEYRKSLIDHRTNNSSDELED